MADLLNQYTLTSVQAMKLSYPSLTFDYRPIIIGGDVFWQGWVQPIGDLENLEWILADIDQNRPVQTRQDGEVIHHPNCQRTHQELRWLKKLKKPDQAFKIKITYGGGSRHPRCFVVDPKIPKNKQKHMFRDGAVCAYPPQKNLWDWQRHTVSEFADQAVVWLIKWNVWQQTGEWLGEETSHDRVSLYFSIDAAQQCWCGSGVRYGKCHQLQDKLEVDKTLYQLLRRIK